MKTKEAPAKRLDLAAQTLAAAAAVAGSVGKTLAGQGMRRSVQQNDSSAKPTAANLYLPQSLLCVTMTVRSKNYPMTQ